MTTALPTDRPTRSRASLLGTALAVSLGTLLLAAEPAQARDEFKDGFEHELGRIVAHGVAAIGHAVLAPAVIVHRGVYHNRRHHRSNPYYERRHHRPRGHYRHHRGHRHHASCGHAYGHARVSVYDRPSHHGGHHNRYDRRDRHQRHDRYDRRDRHQRRDGHGRRNRHDRRTRYDY